MINMPSNSKLESKQNGVVSLATTRDLRSLTKKRVALDCSKTDDNKQLLLECENLKTFIVILCLISFNAFVIFF